MLPAKSLGFDEIIIGRDFQALALDRFHDKSRDVTRTQFLFQCDEVVKGTFRQPGQAHRSARGKIDRRSLKAIPGSVHGNRDRKKTTSCRPVTQRANLSAPSTVSVPLLVKKTRDIPSGACFTSAWPPVR